MGTPPSDLPPPPPGAIPPPPPASPTRIVGQEAAPTNAVPMAPPGMAYTPSRSQTNSLAIVSLVAGAVSILGHVVVPGVGGGTIALIAIITGYMSRQQIKQSGEQGMWMATTGMVLGIVHFALLALLIFVLILLIFVFGLALFGLHR